MNPLRKVLCQHNHWMGWCSECDTETDAAIDEMDATGSISSATWATLNHWQRSAVVEGKDRKKPTPEPEGAE